MKIPWLIIAETVVGTICLLTIIFIDVIEVIR
jgi:hypothetical protein